MNETLCRAFIQAQLTEEDVAAHLQVDPKTVRRWLEGRMPYLRHRWAIAAMLDVDETDLWPELRTARTRPDEVLAVYPHRDSVPRDVWLRVLGSARHEIGILDDAGLSFAEDQRIMAVLAERAELGVTLRICLRHPLAPASVQRVDRPESGDTPTADMRDVLAVYAPLREKGQVEIRLRRGVVYNSIYYADDQLLVSQRAYGIPAASTPVLHLQQTPAGDMVAAYLEAFDRAWTDAWPAD